MKDKSIKTQRGPLIMIGQLRDPSLTKCLKTVSTPMRRAFSALLRCKLSGRFLNVIESRSAALGRGAFRALVRLRDTDAALTCSHLPAGLPRYPD